MHQRGMATDVTTGTLGVNTAAIALIVLEQGIGGDGLELIPIDEILYYLYLTHGSALLVILDHDGMKLIVEHSSKTCFDVVCSC